ncbi:class II aaRS and biotin synthetase [Rhizophagus irregularis]|uniref:Probable proline--tRNA ligase, mitochondrial n=1 Tax=Rhizophagus irregularis TaxID=588596 RepID=A0A2N1NKM3_9GLOM|nr:class II aaRS and biotin synthetase [Rhizophagus irregularis]
MYSLLPLALRSLDKIERIIDFEMTSIGAQKLSLSILLSASTWKQTGRWKSAGSELFRLKDRKGSEYCLAPTHEEEITQLVGHEIASYRQLPLRLYQIGKKYRDEMRPRYGLLRGREFIMKDLYTFDTSEEAALRTYEEVLIAYKNIFNKIGVPFVIADADSGNIGGTKSHEFHFLSQVGEDMILTCSNCGYSANEERAYGDGCPICSMSSVSHNNPLIGHNAIEVGHTFLLGTKYSEPLKATFAPETPQNMGELRPIQMGCYGIGISRMLAAIIESSYDEHGIIWPSSVAPYRVCIIPNSDEPLIQQATRNLFDLLTSISHELNGEVLIDDRTNLSLGYRIKDSELVGYPWMMILGKRFLESGRVEIHERRTRKILDVFNNICLLDLKFFKK